MGPAVKTIQVGIGSLDNGEEEEKEEEEVDDLEQAGSLSSGAAILINLSEGSSTSSSVGCRG